MDKTLIEVPTELLQAAKLTAQDARTQLAIRLYQMHRLNEAQARELAGDARAIESLVWGTQATGRVDLDEFISWASHDLKSPLNSMIGFLKVILKGMDGPVNDMQAGDLNTALNGSQRMLTLISHLVDMARLNNGEIALRLEVFSMPKLVEDAVDRWKLANPAVPVELSVNVIDPDLKLDMNYMRNVITNLLTFAAFRVTNGSIALDLHDEAGGLRVTAQSRGNKSRDKYEMDSTMLGFISGSLIRLHGGTMDEPQETDDGVLLSFVMPH